MYFVLPLSSSLKVGNPLDLVATFTFLITASVITGLVARIRDRSALLVALFEQAPGAFVLLLDSEMVVRVNQEFTRIFGYTAQEAMGRSLSELIVPRELRDEGQRHLELSFGGQRVDTETIRQRKDGSRLYVRVLSVPVSMPTGRTAVYAIYHDITERKAAQIALQALSIRLLDLQESERRRMARELHDEIGQLLTSLRLLLRPNGDYSTDPLKTRLNQARTIVADLLVRVRGLSVDLRPAELDQLGLLPALLALFERYTAQTGVTVIFKHNGVANRFASQLETGAYRIVQEALTNAARHAGVTDVTVRVWSDGNTLNLQIHDRGSGFDPNVVLKAAQTSGLIGMQERAVLL